MLGSVWIMKCFSVIVVYTVITYSLYMSLPKMQLTSLGNQRFKLKRNISEEKIQHSGGFHIKNSSIKTVSIKDGKHDQINEIMNRKQKRRRVDDSLESSQMYTENGTRDSKVWDTTATIQHKGKTTVNNYNGKERFNQIPALEVSYPPLLFGNNGAGLMGEAVTINTATLKGPDKIRYEEGFKRHGFNELVSDMISVDRPLPDIRNPLCVKKTYPIARELPTTSVIICFRNEAWSVLVRTVHSVINTSPPHLLKEIILVDDYSDYDYLKLPLEDYMKRFPKVKILRNEKREGLIRSRLAGARHAIGKVLTFLDSHIECITGWLPPLLSRISENSSHVVWPSIPGIDRNTFKVEVKPRIGQIQVGTFNWNLDFTWGFAGPDASRGRTSSVDPLKSPTMAGGLFSIDRGYFHKMGSYDEGMNFWGAENLEISFRIWMCGGRIEIIPCSVICHIFRHHNPNSTPQNIGSVDLNKQRLAFVWLDEYRDIYFTHTGHGNRNISYDLRSRMELRKNLKCHNFTWYIENVYPSLFLPSKALSKGHVQSARDSGLCLSADNERRGSVIYVTLCERDKKQVFYRTALDELRQMTMCVDVGKRYPVMYPCHQGKGSQELVYRKDKTFYHPSSMKCLQWEQTGTYTFLSHCDGNDFQLWEWEEGGVLTPL